MERGEEFEDELTSAREDMIDVMDGDGWVVKLVDSPMVEEYAVGRTDQPVIVMFRNGLPVIYDGPANEEVMLETLVMFYTSSCTLCSRLTATMETLACKHRGRMNVARINKETYGEKTGRRFELGLEDKPDIIFFRQGKMYQYTAGEYDPESLSNYMAGQYANTAPQDIPLPKSPLSDLVQLCLDYLVAYPLLVGSCLCVPVLFLVAFLYLIRSEGEPKPRKSKKKKKEE